MEKHSVALRYINMKSNKKADLSIQLIVVVVIALVILVIVLAITSGKLKIFGKTAASCETRGGDCKVKGELSDGKCREGSVEIPGTDCEASEKCCQEIFKSDQLKEKGATSGIDFEDKAGPATNPDGRFA